MGQQKPAWWVFAVAALFAAFHGAQAQASRVPWPLPVDPAGATTGSRSEDELLVLQLAGRAPLIQTSIRSFSATVRDTLVSAGRPAGKQSSRIRWSQPIGAFWYNTQRAYSENDGVVWAGRGLSASLSGGAIASIGPFSFAVRPIVFWTQNSAFQPPLDAPVGSFANPAYPANIDLPYRFGSGSYARLDPGESWAQLDTRYVVAGFSTATQAWGPMHVFPLLLGPNAGGFPHVLFGTGLPWNIGIGRISARATVGRLDPSPFALDHSGDPRRLASGLVAVFTPAGLDGLEVGGGRFFHRRWPTDGINASVLRIPFEAVLKNRLPTKDSPDAVADNQLLSVFFRIVSPPSGIEFYGEFLRDDHSYDLLDVVREPEHESAWALGLRRLWQPTRAGQPVTTFTFEVCDGRISHLVRLRSQSPMYVHSSIVEGHTLRGQLLASPAVFGGSGYALNFSRRTADGGWTASFRSEAIAQNQEGGTWNGTHVGFHSLELARITKRGRIEYTAGIGTQLGWNALSGGNNLSLSLTLRPTTIMRATPGS